MWALIAGALFGFLGLVYFTKTSPEAKGKQEEALRKKDLDSRETCHEMGSNDAKEKINQREKLEGFHGESETIKKRGERTQQARNGASKGLDPSLLDDYERKKAKFENLSEEDKVLKRAWNDTKGLRSTIWAFLFGVLLLYVLMAWHYGQIHPMELLKKMLVKKRKK